MNGIAQRITAERHVLVDEEWSTLGTAHRAAARDTAVDRTQEEAAQQRAAPDRCWRTSERPRVSRNVRRRDAHRLYGVTARAVARRQDNDDVLFEFFGSGAPNERARKT